MFEIINSKYFDNFIDIDLTHEIKSQININFCGYLFRLLDILDINYLMKKVNDSDYIFYEFNQQQ